MIEHDYSTAARFITTPEEKQTIKERLAVHTIAILKKRCDEVNQFTGMTFAKKSVASNGSCKQVLQSLHLSPEDKNTTLPQTDILTQININNVRNTETAKADVFRDMGIVVL